MEKYDVALSFAGEDRLHAKELARLLKSGGYRVFYDDYENLGFGGKSLRRVVIGSSKPGAVLRDVLVRTL